MMWGKLQKIQRERLTSFMLYDSWLKITFTWSLFIHLDPPMQAAEKRYFHLERKQYQQFSHFVKEFYSHSFMHAPSSWKLNTIQDSFQDFKECKAGLINGNTSNKIYYWTYTKEIRIVCNLFFFHLDYTNCFYFGRKNFQWNKNSLGKEYRMLKIWKTGKSAEQQVVLSKKVLLLHYAFIYHYIYALHGEIVRGTAERGVRPLIKWASIH